MATRLKEGKDEEYRYTMFGSTTHTVMKKKEQIHI